MFAEALILATAFELGPFYAQRDDFMAVRPVVSKEADTTDDLVERIGRRYNERC